MTPEKPEPDVRHKPFWWWFLPRLLAFVVVALVGWVGLRCYQDRQDEAERQAAISELDESEPGWRLENLLAARPEVPDEENSAPRIVAIADALPPDWDDPEKEEEPEPLEPNLAFDAPRLEALDSLLAPVAAQRKMARELVRYPRGRHKVVLAERVIETLMKDQSQTQRVARLLQLDALERAQRGDITQALLSCRAGLHVAASLKDEPIIISQLLRMSNSARAMEGVERALALGKANDAALREMQLALLPYLDNPGHLLAMRGERGFMHEVAGGLATGTTNMRDMQMMVEREEKEWAVWGWLRWLVRWGPTVIARREHPEILRYLTQMVKGARLPTHEQADFEADIDAEIQASEGLLVRLLTPAYGLVGRKARRCIAQARSLHALLGCERYRLKLGKWPEKLADLVPAYLTEVPADPCNGEPMRYERWADGVEVTSVGEAGADAGGKLFQRNDYGYRLWDSDKRRQRAPPRKVEEEP
jgi:hypothetical protein